MEARSPATRLPQEPRTWARRMSRAVVTGEEREGNRSEREITDLPGHPKAPQLQCPHSFYLCPPSPPPHTVHVLEGTLPPYTPGLVSWVNLGFLLLLWDNSCPPFELSSFGHPLPERQTSMRGPWSGCCPITALIQLPWHSASPN